MERIKRMVRLLCMIAFILLLGTWIPICYTKSESALHAYDDFQTHLASIAQTFDKEKEYQPLMSEDEFAKGLSEEQLDVRIMDWLTYHAGSDQYREATIMEVKTTIIDLYENQRTIANDEVLTQVMGNVRMVSMLIIILSGGFLWLLKHKETHEKEKGNVKNKERNIIC